MNTNPYQKSHTLASYAIFLVILAVSVVIAVVPTRWNGQKIALLFICAFLAGIIYEWITSRASQYRKALLQCATLIDEYETMRARVAQMECKYWILNAAVEDYARTGLESDKKAMFDLIGDNQT